MIGFLVFNSFVWSRWDFIVCFVALYSITNLRCRWPLTNKKSVQMHLTWSAIALFEMIKPVHKRSKFQGKKNPFSSLFQQNPDISVQIFLNICMHKMIWFIFCQHRKYGGCIIQTTTGEKTKLLFPGNIFFKASDSIRISWQVFLCTKKSFAFTLMRLKFNAVPLI